MSKEQTLDKEPNKVLCLRILILIKQVLFNQERRLIIHHRTNSLTGSILFFPVNNMRIFLPLESIWGFYLFSIRTTVIYWLASSFFYCIDNVSLKKQKSELTFC